MLLPSWFDTLGVMAWPLTLCLAIVITIVLERIVFFIRHRHDHRKTCDELSHILLNHHNKAIRDEMVSLALQELQLMHLRGLKTLRIIGSLAPMIGLLGTIIGIITAFKVIAHSTTAIAPNMIADGLWQAMLTTCFGLCIALPSLIMAHIFKHISDKKLQGMCLTLNRLSITIETQ